MSNLIFAILRRPAAHPTFRRVASENGHLMRFTLKIVPRDPMDELQFKLPKLVDIEFGVADHSGMKEPRKSPLGDSGHILNVKEDVTQLLVLRFQQLLSERLLFPGTKLPPERELAANFGVARSLLRPALKVLVIMGDITQKVWRWQLPQQRRLLSTVRSHGVSLSPRYLAPGAH
jgi:hypothetical protein